MPVSPGGIWLSSHSFLISDLESRSLTCESIIVWRQPFYKIAQHNVTFTGWVPSVDLFTFIQIRNKIKCMSEASLVPFQLLTQFQYFHIAQCIKTSTEELVMKRKDSGFPFQMYNLHTSLPVKHWLDSAVYCSSYNKNEMIYTIGLHQQY
jgi:hypothetical protein